MTADIDPVPTEYQRMNAEIERLTVERDDARAAQLAAEKTNAPLLTARAEVERLRAALEPFAEVYDMLVRQGDAPRYQSVDIASLREARRALGQKP